MENWRLLYVDNLISLPTEIINKCRHKKKSLELHPITVKSKET